PVVEEETAHAVHELRLAEDVAARGDGEPHPTASRRTASARRADEGAVHRFADGARRRAAADDQTHERRAAIREGDDLRGRRRKPARGRWLAAPDERRPIRPYADVADRLPVATTTIAQRHHDVLDQVQRPAVGRRTRHAEDALGRDVAHAQATHAVGRPVQVAGIVIVAGDMLALDGGGGRDRRGPDKQERYDQSTERKHAGIPDPAACLTRRLGERQGKSSGTWMPCSTACLRSPGADAAFAGEALEGVLQAEDDPYVGDVTAGTRPGAEGQGGLWREGAPHT